jgi:hypothetical protein
MLGRWSKVRSKQKRFSKSEMQRMQLASVSLSGVDCCWRGKVGKSIEGKASGNTHDPTRNLLIVLQHRELLVLLLVRTIVFLPCCGEGFCKIQREMREKTVENRRKFEDLSG